MEQLDYYRRQKVEPNHGNAASRMQVITAGFALTICLVLGAIPCIGAFYVFMEHPFRPSMEFLEFLLVCFPCLCGIVGAVLSLRERVPSRWNRLRIWSLSVAVTLFTIMIGVALIAIPGGTNGEAFGFMLCLWAVLAVPQVVLLMIASLEKLESAIKSG